MTTSVTLEARAQKVKVTGKELIVHLVDGRRLEVPLSWFPKLLHAAPAKRNCFRLIGDGIGIHWPDLDEDLSISGLMASH
jgi:hypothetical protein